MIRRIRQRPHAPRGNTLVEVAVSNFLVAVLMLASLQAVGQSTRSQRLGGQRAVGYLLADALLNEISTLAYSDPTTPTAPLGPDAGESVRSTFDDVDDYNNLVESPPSDKQGNVASGRSGWTRRVYVKWVDASNLTNTVSSDSGVKSLVVEAWYQGQLIATAFRLRTNVP